MELKYNRIDNYFSEVISKYFKNIEEIQILEIGCGERSCFNDTELNVIAIDKSEVKIQKAKSVNNNGMISFLNYSIFDVELEDDIDLVADPHCLHCLTGEDIHSALGIINTALKSNGILASEVMISHSNMKFDDMDLLFDSPRLLYQHGNKVEQIRTILSANDWEELLSENGFKIEEFIVFEQFNFSAHPYREQSLQTDPQVLRFIAKKSLQ